MAIYAHIVGWGKYVPDRIVTNNEIADLMDTSDDWIKSRTGISERRHADPEKGETTASMAITAAQLALDRARINPSAVDMIIVATLSPEHLMPSTAALVQDAIGASHAGAFDLSAACSGFVYAFAMGSSLIQSGTAKVVLVIGSETVSTVLDKEDRGVYPLFGDGAGALVLQAHDTPGGVMSTMLGADGSGAEHLTIPAGGSKHPTSQDTLDQRLHYMRMNGREVYRFATRVMGKASRQACEKAGLSVEDIDLFIPHQANIRIIQSASKSLNISQDKIFTNLQKYGNTSAASIPIALCEAIEEERVKTHDKIVMVGFGGGLTWGATVVEWGMPMPYKHRQWWYRTLRWMVYKYAVLRSGFIRIRRRLEIIMAEEDADASTNQPVEKTKSSEKELPPKPVKPPKKASKPEQNGHQSPRLDLGTNGASGNGTGPTKKETAKNITEPEESGK